MESSDQNRHISNLILKLGGIRLDIQYEDLEEVNNIIPENKNTLELDQTKRKISFQVEISGISVYFPYKPYECQVEYMEKGKVL
jgi:hypothetical protein